MSSPMFPPENKTEMPDMGDLCWKLLKCYAYTSISQLSQKLSAIFPTTEPNRSGSEWENNHRDYTPFQHQQPIAGKLLALVGIVANRLTKNLISSVCNISHLARSDRGSLPEAGCKDESTRVKAWWSSNVARSCGSSYTERRKRMTLK